MTEVALESLDKFICIIANRVNKEDWHSLPQRTRNVFYNYKDIKRWLNKATMLDKAVFLQDLNFTTAISVFPDGDFDISDIPSLSEYTIDVKNRIKSMEKQIEKEFFCVCTRELGTNFYNMSVNSNSKMFILKQNYKELQEASDRGIESYSSAIEADKAEKGRDGILKFVLNLLMDVVGRSIDLSLQEITILFILREYYDVGVKSETIHNAFKGSVGERMVLKYLSGLSKQGYINRIGGTNGTAYFLSTKGVFFINDYADRLMKL